MAVIRNPDSGITKPWVIPHADWTITKSEKCASLFQECALRPALNKLRKIKLCLKCETSYLCMLCLVTHSASYKKSYRCSCSQKSRKLPAKKTMMLLHRGERKDYLEMDRLKNPNSVSSSRFRKKTIKPHRRLIQDYEILTLHHRKSIGRLTMVSFIKNAMVDSPW